MSTFIVLNLNVDGKKKRDRKNYIFWNGWNVLLRSKRNTYKKDKTLLKLERMKDGGYGGP